MFVMSKTVAELARAADAHFPGKVTQAKTDSSRN